jgi:hypothetical protein
VGGKKVSPKLQQGANYDLRGDRWDKDLQFDPEYAGWPRMTVDVDDIGAGEDVTAVKAAAFFATCSQFYDSVMKMPEFRKKYKKLETKFFKNTGIEKSYVPEEY